MNEFDRGKIGPRGTCAWCGELDYGGHEDCEQNYMLVLGSGGAIYTFEADSMDPDWRSWDCLGFDEKDLYAQCERKYGRTRTQCDAMRLKPVKVRLADIPEKYRPKFDGHDPFADIAAIKEAVDKAGRERAGTEK